MHALLKGQPGMRQHKQRQRPRRASYSTTESCRACLQFEDALLYGAGNDEARDVDGLILP